MLKDWSFIFINIEEVFLILREYLFPIPLKNFDYLGLYLIGSGILVNFFLLKVRFYRSIQQFEAYTIIEYQRIRLTCCFFL